MNLYLYFTHREDISNIIKSSVIDARKSKIKNTGNITIMNAGKPIVAYVYNIAKISESKCYITYPIDQYTSKYIWIFKKVLGIPIVPKLVKGFRIPTQLRAIKFSIRNEKDLSDWFLLDINLKEKIYCESISTKSLIISNIEEINLNDALEIIGLTPPYINFIDHFHQKNGILISNDYLIG